MDYVDDECIGQDLVSPLETARGEEQEATYKKMRRAYPSDQISSDTRCVVPLVLDSPVRVGVLDFN